MKEIKAIIRPFKLLDVKEALQRIEGLSGVIVPEIKVFGKSRTKNVEDKTVYELVGLIPGIKLKEVVVDVITEEVVNVKQKYSHTGNTGDGKIFVSEVKSVVKIRNNERKWGQSDVKRNFVYL